MSDGGPLALLSPAHGGETRRRGLPELRVVVARASWSLGSAGSESNESKMDKTFCLRALL